MDQLKLEWQQLDPYLWEARRNGYTCRVESRASRLGLLYYPSVLWGVGDTSTSRGTYHNPVRTLDLAMRKCEHSLKYYEHCDASPNRLVDYPRWIQERRGLSGMGNSFASEYLKPVGVTVLALVREFVGRKWTYRGVNYHGLYLKWQLGPPTEQEDRERIAVCGDLLRDEGYEVELKESANAKDGRKYITLKIV